MKSVTNTQLASAKTPADLVNRGRASFHIDLLGFETATSPESAVGLMWPGPLKLTGAMKFWGRLGETVTLA
jgi:hypothetical protein